MNYKYKTITEYKKLLQKIGSVMKIIINKIQNLNQ